MRVAIVGPTHPFKGGVAQHTTVLAKRVADAGHDVELVSWLRQYPKQLYPGRQEVDAREFEPIEATRRVLSWNRPDTWIRVGRQLRDHDLVIIAHITPVQVAPYWTLLAAVRGGRARSVIISHNVLPHERSRIDKRAVSLLFGAADRIIAHSDSEAALARELTRTPVVAARMAPALPDGFVRGAPACGEHRRLIFFGIVRPYKGLDVLLKALPKAPDDVRLRVVGEFWGGTAETEQLCRDLGIADRVEIRDGYLAADKVPALFADVDALVLPYRTATGSQGVCTAFEFGVPAIVTRAGRLADDVRDGIDGLVVDPGDVEQMADALNRFYQPGVPERMRSDVRPVDPGPHWDRYLAAVVADADRPEASEGRAPQLAYSDTQEKMLDEQHRRGKAKKILSVLHHHLGRDDLSGLSALDIGCSAGFIADELATDGAKTIGVDIDEPGLERARIRFGGRVEFVNASGDDLPLPDESLDVVVFNHIYEHVLDPDAVVAEIRRVLKPTGVVYLGLANKHQIIEPHHRLPMLSWLPQRVADAYIRRFGKADHYYERHRTRAGLRRMLRGFHVWDYTIPVIVRPELFSSRDQIVGVMSKLPVSLVNAALPIVPTFVWVATKSSERPAAAEGTPGLKHLDLTGRER
jgi:glycosyltransferase involved in cell wall biosynthesis/ubiquinone/menaquinone biosynthesis C-methylase UbiE